MKMDSMAAGAREIRSITWGYWRSQILFVAAQLGLFDLLVKKAATPKEVAQELKISERGAGILLEALAGLGLLVKGDGRFGLSEAMGSLLAADGLYSMRGAVEHCANLKQCWEELERCVRTGEPCPAPAKEGDALALRRAGFMEAMKSNARVVAEEIYERAVLRDCKRLLDVGCGPATFAIEFARRNPALGGTLVDIAEILSITEKELAAAGLKDRFELRPGDFREVDFGSGRYDAVFASHVLHMYDAATNEKLLRKAYAALAPGGRVIVHEYMLADEGPGPVEAAVFAVNMLVGTCGGNCYSAKEIRQWLGGIGYGEFHFVELEWGTRLLLGKKVR